MPPLWGELGAWDQIWPVGGERESVADMEWSCNCGWVWAEGVLEGKAGEEMWSRRREGQAARESLCCCGPLCRIRSDVPCVTRAIGCGWQAASTVTARRGQDNGCGGGRSVGCANERKAVRPPNPLPACFVQCKTDLSTGLKMGEAGAQE